MAAIQIIVSVLMFVVVLIAIQKKFHPVTTLLAVGVVVLFFWGGIMGVTGVEASSGSFWLDAFEAFRESSMSYIASTGLTVMSVLGYVALMDHLHATDLFAYYLSQPLKKVKNPYVVGALVIVIGFLFLCALPSGVSNVVLLYGVIYPIMRAVGLSTVSSISAITIGCAVCGYIGPANPVSGLVISQLGNATTMGELFITALPYIVVYLVAALVVYFFSARFFDKSDARNGRVVDAGETKEFDISAFNRPRWYAVLPVLPLAFVVIFSSLVAKTVILTVVAATFLSFVIVFIIELLYMRKTQETFAEAVVFYKGMGSAFGTATIVGIAGTLFSTALTMVGGIELLASKVASIPNLPIGVILILFTVIHAVMFYVTGSGPVCIFTLMPILNTLLTTAGRADLLVPAAVCILLVAQSIGQACTPISAATLFISGATGVAPTTVSKRNLPPAVIGGIVTLAAIMLFLV